MIVPMVAYGEILGTLGVLRLTNDAPYSNEALLALEALADRATLALGEARHAPRRLTAGDYEAIFRHSVDGVMFTTPDGRIFAANPATCQILRRSERDICLAGRHGIVVDDERARAAVAGAWTPATCAASSPCVAATGHSSLPTRHRPSSQTRPVSCAPA